MKKIEISGDGIHGVVVAKRINELIDHVEKLEAKAREEHLLPSMDELLERAYQQGRHDKYQEVIACCMPLTEEQVKDIRNDAIDEYFNELYKASEIARPVGWLNAKDIVTIQRARDIAERMKEGKHDKD